MKIIHIPRAELENNAISLSPGVFFAKTLVFNQPTVPLSEVADLNPESSKDGMFGSPVLYADVSSIDPQAGILAEPHRLELKRLPERARWLARPGDVLLSTIRPSRGTVAIVPPTIHGLIVSDALVVVRPRRIPGPVLWAWLRSELMRQWLAAMATGLTPRITLTELESIPVPASVSKTALKTSSLILDALSIYSDTERTPSDGKEALSELLGISDWGEDTKYFLVRHSELDSKRLDPRYYKPSYAWLWSKIRETNYPVVNLSELSKILIGTPTHSTGIGRPIPFLEPECVNNDGSIETRKARELPSVREPVTVSAGDVIVILVGERIGLAAVIRPENEGFAISNSMAIVRPSDRVSPEWIVEYLNSRIGKALIGRLSSGTTVPRISGINLGRVPVITPIKSEQFRLLQYIVSTKDGSGSRSVRANFSDLEQRLIKELSDG